MVKLIRLFDKTIRIDNVIHVIGEVDAFDGGNQVIVLLQYDNMGYIELRLSRQQAMHLKQALEHVTR